MRDANAGGAAFFAAAAIDETFYLRKAGDLRVAALQAINICAWRSLGDEDPFVREKPCHLAKGSRRHKRRGEGTSA